MGFFRFNTTARYTYHTRENRGFEALKVVEWVLGAHLTWLKNNAAKQIFFRKAARIFVIQMCRASPGLLPNASGRF
jgi:hypothetical protein